MPSFVPSYTPGQRIEARCTRCKDTTGHVIVALIDGAVAKVECCACKSVHKYYPPENKNGAASAKPIRVKAGQERVAVAQKMAEKAPKEKLEKAAKTTIKQEQMEKEWERALALAPGQPIAYTIEVPLKEGLVVDHKVFGKGIVRVCTPPDKAEILFKDGIKPLRCKC